MLPGISFATPSQFLFSDSLNSGEFINVLNIKSIAKFSDIVKVLFRSWSAATKSSCWGSSPTSTRQWVTVQANLFPLPFSIVDELNTRENDKVCSCFKGKVMQSGDWFQNLRSLELTDRTPSCKQAVCSVQPSSVICAPFAQYDTREIVEPFLSTYIVRSGIGHIVQKKG